MQLVSAIAGPGRAAIVRQEVGEQQVTPAGAIVQRSVRIGCLNIRTRAGNKCRVADEHQPVRSSRFAGIWLAPDSNTRYLDIVQSPTSDGNRAGNPGGIIDRCIEAAKRRAWSPACDIHLDLLWRVGRAGPGDCQDPARASDSPDLKCPVAVPRCWRDGDVG